MRRVTLAVFLVTTLLGVAACGDDGESSVIAGSLDSLPNDDFVEPTTTTFLEVPQVQNLDAVVEPDVATPTGDTACGAATLYAISGHRPSAVAVGDEGSVWFTMLEENAIGHLTPAGQVSLNPLPPGTVTTDIAADGVGSVWFTVQQPPSVGVMRPDGSYELFPLPTTIQAPTGGPGLGSNPSGIVAGPDGAMWFVEAGADQLGRVAPDGTITEIPFVGSERMHVNPIDLAVGPDGAIWVTAPLRRSLGRYDIGTGEFTELPLFQVDDLGAIAGNQLAVGLDGNLWYEEPRLPGFGSLSPEGETELFPYEPLRYISAIQSGPEGVWFALAQEGVIGRIDAGGDIAEWYMPPEAIAIGFGRPSLLVEASDGAMWFAMPDGNRLGRIPCA